LLIVIFDLLMFQHFNWNCWKWFNDSVWN